MNFPMLLTFLLMLDSFLIAWLIQSFRIDTILGKLKKDVSEISLEDEKLCPYCKKEKHGDFCLNCGWDFLENTMGGEGK